MHSALILLLAACSGDASDSEQRDLDTEQQDVDTEQQDVDTEQQDVDTERPRETTCPDPTSGAQDTGVIEPDTVDQLGSCDEPAADCVASAGRTLFRLEDGVNDPFPTGNRAEIITDAATWQARWTQLFEERPRPSVDFETEQVLLAGYVINATCDTGVIGSRLEQCGDRIRLTVDAEDRSGTCFSTCDAPGSALMAVAVPNSLTGETCATVCRSCF